MLDLPEIYFSPFLRANAPLHLSPMPIIVTISKQFCHMDLDVQQKNDKNMALELNLLQCEMQH